MKIQDAPSLLEQLDKQQRNFLQDHGWVHVMWRWYWVWRKEAHDITFSCLTLDEAIKAENALQTSEWYFQPPTTKDVT